METRSQRRVNLTRYNDETSIMLAWKEKEQGGEIKEMDKFIRVSNKDLGAQVEQAVNRLVTRWVHVFFSSFDVQFVSECLDDRANYFDAITESDNPKQQLVEFRLNGE